MPTLRQAVLALFATATFAIPGPATAAVTYTYTTLLSLGGPQGNGTGWAINNQGHVVGGSMPATDPMYMPTLWPTPGTPVALGLLSHQPALAVAYGLNNRGQAVGSDAFGRAILWNGTQATELPSLGGSSSEAMAINDAGQVAGWSFSSPSSGLQATLWQNGQPINLGTLGGRSSWATDINSSGQIAGAADRAFGSRAVLWTNGVARDLGTWHGHASFAQGLNDTGHVVGHDVDDQGASHAFWWNGSTMSLLTPLEGDGAWSAAADINNRDQVVGYSIGQGDQRATLWDEGRPTDLNSFLDRASVQAGWHLIEAHAINENGWITGLAINRTLRQHSAFVMAPVAAVPEPATLALALAGLATLVAARRREGHASAPTHRTA